MLCLLLYILKCKPRRAGCSYHDFVTENHSFILYGLCAHFSEIKYIQFKCMGPRFFLKNNPYSLFYIKITLSKHPIDMHRMVTQK